MQLKVLFNQREYSNLEMLNPDKNYQSELFVREKENLFKGFEEILRKL